MSGNNDNQVTTERHLNEMKTLNQKVTAFTKELTLIKLDLGDLINVNIDIEKRFYALEKHMQSLPGFVLVNDFTAGMDELRELVTKAHNMGQKAIAAKEELTNTVQDIARAQTEASAAMQQQADDVLRQFKHTQQLAEQTRLEAERYRKRLNILNILVAALIGIIIIFAIIWLSGVR